MTTGAFRSLTVIAATSAVAAGGALAGPAQAAAASNGCNTRDVSQIQACYVNRAGGGWVYTVHNYRKTAVLASSVGTARTKKVGPGGVATFTFATGSFQSNGCSATSCDMGDIYRTSDRLRIGYFLDRHFVPGRSSGPS